MNNFVPSILNVTDKSSASYYDDFNVAEKSVAQLIERSNESKEKEESTPIPAPSG
jgi:hypothetical protein